MLSVFDGRYRDLTNFTSNEYLHINSSGVSYMRYVDKPRSVRFYRPDGRVDCHFLLVTNGCLIAEVDGREYKLKVGDALFYKPNDPQCYTVSVDENCSYEEHLYVHFCGTVSEEILLKAGLDRSCVILNTSGEAKRVFEVVLRCYRSGDEMTAVGNLLRLTALLSPKVQAPQNIGAKLILSEAEFISSHYSEEIDLNACAERCGFSRSRFTHLFTEVVGISPYRYQQKFRLEQACELLRSTTLSIGEVSESVGFSDALYFSRLFKKRFGVTPSHYRSGQRK
ncbi:MAG: helix-turn-helix transcriptional regulator [Clostridia bacterium]|nr:helix-turn-helix transcriptional regulator [Clostridia bacterium]